MAEDIEREWRAYREGKPEQPHELLAGPFVFRSNGVHLHLRYDERQQPITGHVLNEVELELLHTLTGALLKAKREEKK